MSPFVVFHLISKGDYSTYFKLNFKDTTVKLFLELSDDSFRFAFVNSTLIYVGLNQSETFDLLTSFSSRAGHAQSTWKVKIFKIYFIFVCFLILTYIDQLSNNTKTLWAYDVSLSII